MQTGIHVWFIHESDMSNLLLAVPELLNNLFPEHWIGGGGPKERRVRSPNLNPLYFNLWRYLKSVFFSYRIHLRPGLATANAEWI